MILAAALKGFFAIFSMVVAAIVVAIFLAIRTTHWVSQRMANALSFPKRSDRNHVLIKSNTKEIQRVHLVGEVLEPCERKIFMPPGMR